MTTMVQEKTLMKMEDVLATGPVERGFYIAQGPRDITYRVLDGLVELLKRQTLATSDQPELPLAQLSSGQTPDKKQWRRDSHIGQIIWVDSGNLFDPYYMCAMAKQKGMDPNKILRSVRMGRPFTAFQYHQMLANIPNAALVATPPRGHQSFGASAAWWTPLVIISDLMGLFYDPELPQDDMKRAFYQFLLRLSFLKERAIVLAVLHDEEPPADLPAVAGRKDLLNQLYKMIAPKHVGVRQWYLEPAA